MRTRIRRSVLVLAAAAAAACTHLSPLRRAPASLELVAATDAAYAAADPAGATGVPGEGKVTTPYVVRLTRDLPVYRLWAGPAVKDAQGRTSRIGQWWTFDDAWSIGQKITWLKSKNLLGVMAWEMSGDTGNLMSAVSSGLG